MSTSERAFRHSQVAVGGGVLHVVEAGDPAAPPVLFLHGWPESWYSWRHLLALAAPRARAIAIDLPGIGGSAGMATDGRKGAIAAVVHDLIGALGLRDVTLVGQDAGGMVVYPYLRAYTDIARAVIMDVVIPGVPPWREVVANPRIWHFAFHSIPKLPERLVQGRQADYFAFFYEVISRDAARITPDARAAYAEAYATDTALTAGFDWYRAFPRDAEENARAAAGPPTDTPLLYLRGEFEGGDVATYARGFAEAGVVNVATGVVPDAGHFAQEENPEDVWRRIAAFAGL